MEYFKKYFKDVEDWSSEEVKVLCPFHSDTNPSASINTEKGLFHCWVCDIGYNETQFAAKVNGISTTEAIKLLDNYNDKDYGWDVSIAELWGEPTFLNKVRELGLSDKTINELKLGLRLDENTKRRTLGIPVFYNNILVDVRRYNLLKYQGMAKVISEGDRVGWLIPYDAFIKSDGVCYIFEGEKDMLIAREKGLNAYTLTGGAGAIPNEFTIGAFENKEIVVCYDNDKAGQDGMLKLYSSVKDIVKNIKYINIGDTVKEDKGDVYDFFIKYNQNALDFYLLEEHIFDNSKIEKESRITIKEALSRNILKKYIKSVVTITAEFADSYSVPAVVKFEKGMEVGKKDTMYEGETKSWYLEKDNYHQLLELIEVSAKSSEVKSKLRGFVGIPNSEENVKMVTRDLRTVYKSTIVDKDIDGSAINLDLYSFEKLNVGGQYIIDYIIYPHPTKHQKLVAICSKSIMTNDNKNFILNKKLLESLKTNGTIEERLNYLYQSAKHYIAAHLKFNTWLMADLVFNSILDFNYGGLMRGALDVFFLGDTHTGKSEATSKLVELYNFGHFLSLKTSTTTGLIGGSSKVDGSFCNTIGAIPRQHKRLVVMEEFSGAKPDFIKTMTDIRSSNEVRLSRVAGELIVPCKLRMLTISNPRNDENGNPRFLSTFPNGVMPIMELITSAEDVARYDGFLLIPKVEDRFNPFKHKLEGEPIPRECYSHKINWVVTRQPENVKFEDGVESYIWEKANELNKKFECNFPVFNIASHKKLARFCVALASLILNVDSSYENIIVTKEIVDYMCNKLDEIYISPAFKLNDYVEDYKAHSEYTEEDIEELSKLYSNNATLLDQLSKTSKTTRNDLAAISGIGSDKFTIVFNKLVSMKLITLGNYSVYPTDKFRKVYNLIDKNFTIDTGEMESKNNSSGVSFINDLEKEKDNGR